MVKAADGFTPYSLPPKEIEELIDGVPSPAFMLSPTGQWALVAGKSYNNEPRALCVHCYNCARP